ncbi:MAG: 50S ribosomal protein L25, partial [Rikenellaceae bacterium]|nr:50S ribosomal protein L25 [Rikenellaceae bacterium]
MQTIEISGSVRNAFGKKEAKNERKEGKVPCVIYGNGDTVHFTVSEADIRKIIFTPSSYIVNIKLDGNVETAVV